MVKKTKSYDVGYKKPPKATQFKKGASGNPSGRRRQPRDIEMLLSIELNRTLSFNENGKIGKQNKLHLMIRQAVNKAVAGDFRPLEQLIKVRSILNTAQVRPDVQKVDRPKMTPDEIIENYMRFVRAPREERIRLLENEK
jgi:Family of unknown function (DUF5681)